MGKARVLLSALCVAAALVALPASASAATVSTSCSKTALLLPGVTVACSTPSVACPSGAPGINTCVFYGRAVASAAIGISVGGQVVSNASARFTPDDGSPVSSVSNSAAANCTVGLAILGGCTGQTDKTKQTGAISGPGVLGFRNGIFSADAQGVCVWTGGPIAVIATLTCTESVDYAPA